MGIGGADLNLLVALEALLEEGSVTRAGRRLQVSQPAMSAALGRLRRLFDDELLVPADLGYELTPTALALLPEVRRTLQLMQQGLGIVPGFDPATEERCFKVAVSDYAAAVLLPPLVAELTVCAPRVRLVAETPDPETWGSRRTLADLDALVAPNNLLLPGQHRPLWHDRIALVVDRDNPRLVDGRLTRDDLTRLPLVLGTIGKGTIPPIRQALRDAGVDPWVALQVTGYLPVPLVVRGTDLVAPVPERLAAWAAAADPGLAVVPLPLPDTGLTEAYWFAEARLADPAARWFFGVCDRVARRL